MTSSFSFKDKVASLIAPLAKEMWVQEGYKAGLNHMAICILQLKENGKITDDETYKVIMERVEKEIAVAESKKKESAE